MRYVSRRAYYSFVWGTGTINQLINLIYNQFKYENNNLLHQTNSNSVLPVHVGGGMYRLIHKRMAHYFTFVSMDRFSICRPLGDTLQRQA